MTPRGDQWGASVGSRDQWRRAPLPPTPPSLLCRIIGRGTRPYEEIIFRCQYIIVTFCGRDGRHAGFPRPLALAGSHDVAAEDSVRRRLLPRPGDTGLQPLVRAQEPDSTLPRPLSQRYVPSTLRLDLTCQVSTGLLSPYCRHPEMCSARLPPQTTDI